MLVLGVPGLTVFIPEVAYPMVDTVTDASPQEVIGVRVMYGGKYGAQRQTMIPGAPPGLALLREVVAIIPM